MSINPFSRVPVEIVQEIFSQATDCITLHVHQPLPAGSQSPWFLALVCKVWRDTAFLTPSLWSDISLQLVPTMQTPHITHALLSTWHLCLVRSQSHPLTIELNSGFRDEVPSQTGLFMKPLMENVQRWETVILRVSFDTLLSCLPNYPIQYSCLRHLCLDNFGHGKPAEDAVELFRDAPLLSSISLNCLPYHSQNLGGVGIPWSQISHLNISIRFGKFSDLMDILVYTPNLVTLNYSIIYNYFGGGEPPQLELSHLQQVVWTSDYPIYMDHDGPSTFCFFNLLKAPQLSVLKIYGACGDREVEAIRGCLRRSECSITYLDLPTPRLYSVLSLTPDVKTLVFENAPTLDDDNPITYGSSSDQLELAHLRKLVLRCHFGRTSPIFASLTAPQLSVLGVIGRCDDIELEAIRSFLQRSRCSLTYLEIPTPHLSSLLSCTIDVETLVIPRFDKEALISVLKDLTFGHSASSWLFPKLKKIELDFDIAAGAQFNAFIAMLKSRLWAPLDSLISLQCYELKELELGDEVSKDMGHRVQERLTPQELLIIKYKGIGSVV